MPLLKYDAELCEKVPGGSEVAFLCDGESERLALQARTLERWSVDLSINKALWRDLVSGDDVRFNGGRWHLVVAKLFHSMGFDVDFNHKLGPKTPDLGITKDGLVATVEIFHTARKEETQRQDQLSKRLAELLSERLNFDVGFLAISLLSDLPDEIPEWWIAYMADRINQWLDRGAPGFLAVHRKVDFTAALTAYGDERFVSVLGGNPRLDANQTYAKACESQLRTKLDRYGAVAERPIVLVICNDEFALSPLSVESILYGDEGVLRSGSANRHVFADKVGGVILLSRAVFDESLGFWRLYARHMPNWGSAQLLPSGVFAPITERGADGEWSPYFPDERVISLRWG